MSSRSDRLPDHIAIIMDGNGRWAKARGKNKLEGHRQGAVTAKNIVTSARKAGIKYLTLYAFSYENWKRPSVEVNGLFKLLEDYCKSEMNTMIDEDIQFHVIGEWGKLPGRTRKILKETARRTEHCDSMRFTLALNYSGRREIVNAANLLIKDGVKRVTEKGFEKRMFTFDMPDPDLLIRTSGELRVSNFLLFQCAYSEFFFTNTLWPDFQEEEFLSILEDYKKRDRRYGGA